MGEDWYRAQGIDIVDTDRGGRLTYHGPGQLVGYPIMSLKPYRDDIHEYIRRMESAIIAALADVGIEAGPIEGLTGVWTREPRKIASIGVHVSRGVTTHGFAINVNNDLQPFEWIVPCGIDNCRMTSVAKELHAQFDMERFMDIVSRELGVAFARLPIRQDGVIRAGDGGRVTERLHVTRSRANPGGAADADADVLPFRSRKPPWLKVKAPGGPTYRHIERLMRSKTLHTVCEEANCPNIGECWERGTATFMILGDTCTRRCGFCNVKSGVPEVVDRAEPLRVAHAVDQMGLRHCVVTSVDRDDLPDLGAGRLRGHDPGDPPPGTRLRRRGADARLPRPGDAACPRDRRAAGRVQPQRRDRAAAVPEGAPGIGLQALVQGAPEREAHGSRTSSRSRA